MKEKLRLLEAYLELLENELESEDTPPRSRELFHLNHLLHDLENSLPYQPDQFSFEGFSPSEEENKIIDQVGVVKTQSLSLKRRLFQLGRRLPIF